MTVKQAAKALGCSRSHITNLIRNKKLQAHYEISEDEVERYKSLKHTKGRPRGSKNHDRHV